MSTRPPPPSRSSHGLPDLTKTTVDDILHPGVLSCSPDTPVRDVAAIMATHGIHCVIVDGLAHETSGEHLVWGVLSDLDLLGALDTDDRELNAGTLAGTEVVTVAPGTSVEEAACCMRAHNVTHLLVVDREGRPAGVVSSLDIARAMAGGGGRG